MFFFVNHTVVAPCNGVALLRPATVCSGIPSNRAQALHSQVVALSILLNYLQNLTIFISFDLHWPAWVVQV